MVSTVRRNTGLTVLEILVVLSIIIMFAGVMLARTRDRDSEAVFHKDVTGFVTQVGRALAMADARNSATCGDDESLDRIEIVRTSVSSYSLIPYCHDRANPVVTYTPVPQGAFRLEVSQIDGAASGTTFAVVRAGGSVTPDPKGFTFASGAKTCAVTITTTGIINTSGEGCPPR